MQFPYLGRHTQKMLGVFGSTYVCKQTFCMMNNNRSRCRSRLTNEHLSSAHFNLTNDARLMVLQREVTPCIVPINCWQTLLWTHTRVRSDFLELHECRHHMFTLLLKQWVLKPTDYCFSDEYLNGTPVDAMLFMTVISHSCNSEVLCVSP